MTFFINFFCIGYQIHFGKLRGRIDRVIIFWTLKFNLTICGLFRYDLFIYRYLCTQSDPMDSKYKWIIDRVYLVLCSPFFWCTHYVTRVTRHAIFSHYDHIDPPISDIQQHLQKRIFVIKGQKELKAFLFLEKVKDRFT